MNILLTLFLSSLLTKSLVSSCGTCSSVGISCVSENQFYICVNGVIDITSLTTCPTATVCSDSSVNVCVANVQPSCNTCNTCNSDLRFACVALNKFQLCFGSSTPRGGIYTCPTGNFCNINAAAPDFCQSSTNLNFPICSNLINSANMNATAYCNFIGGTVGRYSVADSTCKSYVNCFSNNTVISGYYYKCPGTTIFSKTINQCVDSSTNTCV